LKQSLATKYIDIKFFSHIIIMRLS